MHYLTHHFAHSETCSRARRWLIQAGIAADRILVNEQGLPRLTVAAEPGEDDVVRMIVRIAGMHDPDGLPGLWDVSHDHPATDIPPAEAPAPPPPTPSASFPLSWHSVDAGPE